MVVVGRIALGRREVSVGEFRSYWTAAGKAKFGADMPSCRDRESIFRSSRKRTWSEPGFAQTDASPVVCVNAAMADGYAAWLAQRTGKRYRLPKAAELTAAGAAVARTCKANVRDAQFRKDFGGREGLECSDGHGTTAPGGSFAAEQAGLYDTGGNVREWVSDCDAGNCRERRAVGGSWASEADDPPVRAFAADTAFNTIGLRVAREID
nr:SUMF1/EgtB/PvdO family nonheme iron enzyme [Chiayiivirga flava]